MNKPEGRPWFEGEKWDAYFYEMAHQVAANVQCKSRAIGAVIVREGKYVVSTGYNGPPTGFPTENGELQRIVLAAAATTMGIIDITSEMHDQCPRRILGFATGKGTGYCPCAHAERNAIDIAAKMGHPVDGCKMYLSCPTPCQNCAFSIINSGISEVIITHFLDYPEEGMSGLQLLEICKVKVRTYSHNAKD